MPRPRLRRKVNFKPNVVYFKPAGVPLRGLVPEVLTFDEVEAIRLKDIKGLEQEEAAKKMDVSRTTFLRILKLARSRIANALIKGLPIRMEGGDYIMPAGDRTGPQGAGPMTGRRGGNIPPRPGIGRGGGAGREIGRPGTGRGAQPGGYGLGPGSECVCPKCDYRMPHQTGVACNQQKCPKCGTIMTRPEIQK